jgi:hypothetical protein
MIDVRAVEEHFSERPQVTGLTRRVGELGQVDPGGEHAPLAPQHDAVNGLIRGGIAQRGGERPQELLVHRVALLRAVQDYVADRAAVLSGDDAHRWLLTFAEVWR